MIFSTSSRDDSSPKKNSESDFAFLDRSARPEIARVRDFMELSVSNYPQGEVAELVARIKCADEAAFRSASFELILHECLRRWGCTLEPHPVLPNGKTTRPDFLVTAPDGSVFYLEAVLATEVNDWNDKGAEARMGRALDALGAGGHPKFVLGIRSEGAPTSQPSGKKLRQDALAWLDTLDPADVRAAIASRDADSMRLVWTHEEWTLTLSPIPLPPERQGKAITLVGSIMRGGSWINAWSPIRDAVKHKGQKYGDLDKPLLVALNFDSFRWDPADHMQALYGQEQVVVSEAGDVRFQRAPNGAWRGPSGPTSRRSSGLWIFNDLTPFTIAARRQTIYFNPWALHPLPGVLTQFPHAVADDEEVQWHEGLSLHSLLDLSPSWPE